MRAVIPGLLVVLTGCASSGDNLHRASAMAIGGNIPMETVTISDIDRSAMSVKWIATTPSGKYNCSADDMVRRPYCTKQ